MALEKAKRAELFLDSKKRLETLRSLKSAAHVHIICVCGTLTASLAQLLKTKGFYVSGSDKTFYPPMDGVVKSVVDKIYQGFSKDNLNPRPDFVLIGNAARKDNEEVLATLEQKIPYASMPEALQVLLIGGKDECPTSIVICGTHGKTTSSAACATVFEKAGRKPAYFIGGIPKDLPTSIRGQSAEIALDKRVAILEGDEYDSSFFQKVAKFHFYRPDILAITSLEFDHADIYNSVEEIEAEFIEVIRNMPETGQVFLCDDNKRLVELKKILEKQVKLKIQLYGSDKNSSYRLLERESLSGAGFAQTIKISLAGEELELELKVSGQHNALNLLLVSAIAKISGLTNKQIAEGASNFSGVLRREQELYNKSGILILEDFAHHPTAVATTLSGLKERYPDKRPIAVLEPRSNTSRRHFFQEEFVRSFKEADCVFFLESEAKDLYSATSGEQKALDFKKLVGDLRADRKEAASYSDVKELSSKLLSILRSGDLLVLMSNGDFCGLKEELLASIDKIAK